jgi:hypothetical protein
VIHSWGYAWLLFGLNVRQFGDREIVDCI